MKNLVICVILLVSLLMSSCGLPQEKKPSSKNQLSITEKEELEKEGYKVVNIDYLISEDKSIKIKLPQIYLQLKPSNHPNSVMLMDTSTKDWIIIKITKCKEGDSSFFDRSDEVISKQLADMYSKHPQFKDVYSAKKINGIWFFITKNENSNYFMTDNAKYSITISMSNRSKETEVMEMIKGVTISY